MVAAMVTVAVIYSKEKSCYYFLTESKNFDFP
jgi:hypothetical protein